MTRYRLFFIIFLFASVLTAGWWFFAVLDYSTAAFDCDLPNLYGPECADAKAKLIARKMALHGLPILALWGVVCWLLMRERKKR